MRSSAARARCRRSSRSSSRVLFVPGLIGLGALAFVAGYLLGRGRRCRCRHGPHDPDRAGRLPGDDHDRGPGGPDGPIDQPQGPQPHAPPAAADPAPAAAPARPRRRGDGSLDRARRPGGPPAAGRPRRGGRDRVGRGRSRRGDRAARLLPRAGVLRLARAGPAVPQPPPRRARVAADPRVAVDDRLRAGAARRAPRRRTRRAQARGADDRHHALRAHGVLHAGHPAGPRSRILPRPLARGAGPDHGGALRDLLVRVPAPARFAAVRPVAPRARVDARRHVEDPRDRRGGLRGGLGQDES